MELHKETNGKHCAVYVETDVFVTLRAVTDLFKEVKKDFFKLKQEDVVIYMYCDKEDSKDNTYFLAIEFDTDMKIPDSYKRCKYFRKCLW